MSEKLCKIAALYLRELKSVAHVRAYENKSPVQGDINVSIAHEALPEAGHHRVALTVRVLGVNKEDVLCYETFAHYEAIVVYANLDDQERDAMMSMHIPGLMLAHIRAAFSNAMSQTGYAALTLPPLTGAQLKQIASNAKEPTPSDDTALLTEDKA